MASSQHGVAEEALEPRSAPVPAKESDSRGHRVDEAIPCREGREAKGMEVGTGLGHQGIELQGYLLP